MRQNSPLIEGCFMINKYWFPFQYAKVFKRIEPVKGKVNSGVKTGKSTFQKVPVFTPEPLTEPILSNVLCL